MLTVSIRLAFESNSANITPTGRRTASITRMNFIEVRALRAPASQARAIDAARAKRANPDLISKNESPNRI